MWLPRSLRVGGYEVGHVASEVWCLASQPNPSYSSRCSMRIATATAFSLVDETTYTHEDCGGLDRKDTMP